MNEDERPRSDMGFDRALFEALWHGSSDTLLLVDAERRIVDINRTQHIDRSTVVGKRIDDFFEGPERDALVKKYDAAFAGGTAGRFEQVHVSADGRGPRTYVYELIPVGTAPVRYLLARGVDITEEREARAALAASEARYRLLAQNLPDLVTLVDRNLEVRWVNRYPSGLTEALVLGRPIAEFSTPATRDDTVRTVSRAFETGEPTSFASSSDLFNGGRRWFITRAVPIQDEDREPRVLLLTTDVTEQRKAELGLQRAQRMEAIGQLAGGIAHDFNNLLLVVLSQVDHARAQAGRGEDASVPLDAIQAAATRAASLTRQLLAVSRRQELQPAPISLRAHIANFLQLLERLIPANISVAHVPLDTRDVVDADPGQLEQVLMNLCLNARDAMPEGGRLTVETERVVLAGGAMVDEPEVSPGTYVAIRVRDTGHGMSEEDRQRMFDPFFTTKPLGRGTGLGLSVTHGIVRQHRGQIRVTSAPGEGTTVEVLWPASEATPAAQRAPQASTAAPGRGTVLLAEDEDMVRSLVAEILQDAGYQVLQASDGQEAVELFEAHASEIDLVMLDAIMPRLGGLGAYKSIAASHPDARFLISSGYSDEDLSPAVLQRPNVYRLDKPYLPTALLQIVRQALAN